MQLMLEKKSCAWCSWWNAAGAQEKKLYSMYLVPNKKAISNATSTWEKKLCQIQLVFTKISVPNVFGGWNEAIGKGLPVVCS